VLEGFELFSHGTEGKSEVVLQSPELIFEISILFAQLEHLFEHVLFLLVHLLQHFNEAH